MSDYLSGNYADEYLYEEEYAPAYAAAPAPHKIQASITAEPGFSVDFPDVLMMLLEVHMSKSKTRKKIEIPSPDNLVLDQEEVTFWQNLYAKLRLPKQDLLPPFQRILKHYHTHRKVLAPNKFSEVYYCLAMKHQINLMVFDADFITYPIELRKSLGGELFLPIGASEEEYEELPAQSAIYVSGNTVIAKNWNLATSQLVQPTGNTKRFTFICETSFFKSQRIFDFIKDIQNICDIDQMARYIIYPQF